MEPLLTRIIEQDVKIQRLESELRQKDRTIAGLKHWLKVAATYQAVPKIKTLHDADPLDTLQRTIEGMQAALLKAAEYEGREQKTRRKGR